MKKEAEGGLLISLLYLMNYPKNVASYTATLCYDVLQVLLPSTGMVMTHWKSKLGFPPGHFGFLMPLTQEVKKRVSYGLVMIIKRNWVNV